MGKHQKLKAIDPFYHGPRKLLLDRGLKKANQAPTREGGSQGIPRKCRAMMRNIKHMNAFNNRTVTKKSRKGQKKTNNDIPEFKMNPGELEEDFLKRINRATREVISKCALEVKFGTLSDKEILDRVARGKKVVSSKPEMHPSGLDLGEKVPSKRAKKKLAKFLEKRKEKQAFKAEMRKDDFGHLKDEVKFGEVSLHPPRLMTKPRTPVNKEMIAKPGQRDLLLNKLMGFAGHSKTPGTLNVDGSVVTGKDRTVKRKLLSMADRFHLEQERANAVQAYKSMKKMAKQKEKDKEIKK